MTKLRKDQDLISDPGNGIEIAYLTAFVAKGTGIGLPLGDHCIKDFLVNSRSADKESGIGFFHIEIGQNHITVFRQMHSQIGGQCRFPGSSFSAGD
jgi:hypothetical protein